MHVACHLITKILHVKDNNTHRACVSPAYVLIDRRLYDLLSRSAQPEECSVDGFGSSAAVTPTLQRDYISMLLPATRSVSRSQLDVA